MLLCSFQFCGYDKHETAVNTITEPVTFNENCTFVPYVLKHHNWAGLSVASLYHIYCADMSVWVNNFE